MALLTQRYHERFALFEDERLIQQALSRLVVTVSAIPAHLPDGDVPPAQAVARIHQTVQALLRRSEGRPYHWLVEREAAQRMLASVLLPAGEAAPDSLLAQYAGAHVRNMSTEYPTVLMALERLRDPAERAALAAVALQNLDVPEAMAAEQSDAFEAYLQASASLPAKAASELSRVREDVGHAWPPMVEVGGHLVPLNVDEARARLQALLS